MPMQSVISQAGKRLTRHSSKFDLNAEAFVIEVANHIEQLDAASIGKLLMHEVRRLVLIDRSWCCQGSGFSGNKLWRGITRSEENLRRPHDRRTGRQNFRGSCRQ